METWHGVDLTAFERHDVWRRPDLRNLLIHLGPLIRRGVALCEVAWTAECGALGLTSLLAQRTGDATARIAGDCPTAPALRVTITLEPTCQTEQCNSLYRATTLTVEPV
jgi:hypothetical protein